MDLLVAIQEGDVQAVKTILEDGTDPNAKVAGFSNALQAAAWWGRVEIVKLLLEGGADVNSRDDRLGTALEAAADKCNTEIVRILLDGGADVNSQSRVYVNALRAAIRGGGREGGPAEEIVKMLLDKGININVQCGEHGNAIQFAAFWESESILELLLERGADVDAQGGKYGTALQTAIHEGNRKIVQLLLDRGTDINVQGGKYGTALQAAALKGNEGVVEVLLDRGATINAQGGKYGTALQAAAVKGNEGIVKVLLDRGADINAQDGKYGTALQAATYKGKQNMVKLLLDRGTDINVQGGKYGTALQAAALKGNEWIVGALLNLGANVNAHGGQYGTALQAASLKGNEGMVEVLLDRGADINAQGGQYGTALHTAAHEGSEGTVKVLLDRGANINAQSGQMGTALHTAAHEGNGRIVEVLLDRGADINTQGGQYGTALHAAVLKGNEGIVKVLLDRGADINAQGGQIGTALHAAALKGNKGVVEVLLNQGADINAQGGQYGTALHTAAYEGNERIVKVLLDQGADINTQGGQYGTALHAAVLKGNEGVVEVLLDRGATINAQGGQYGSALQAARRGGKREIVRLLRDKSASINAAGKDVEDNPSLLVSRHALGLSSKLYSAGTSSRSQPSTSSNTMTGSSNAAYYYGIRGNLCLLASTIPRQAWPRNPTDRAYTSKKHFFPLGTHPIGDKWETKILPLIIPLNIRGGWLSIHCLRIGFETQPGDNPIILLLVKPSFVSPIEAVELALSIQHICEGVELEDVEVEIAEMPMMHSRAGTGDQAHVLSGPFDNNPYIGASIGPCLSPGGQDDLLWCGTFAAYLSAKEKTQAGDRILLALTNDHVCFDVDEMDENGDIIPAVRPCLEPNLVKRAFKSKGAHQKYLMRTPAIPDYAATEKALGDDYERAKAKYERNKNLPTQGLNHPTTVKAKEKLELAMNALSNFGHAMKTLGFVYGTGGDRVDAGSRMPMDWGVVKALDDDPIHNYYSILNKLPPRDLQDPVNTEHAIKQSTIRHQRRTNPTFSELLDEIDLDTLPSQISEMRSAPPEADEVFFKVGRTTGWTAGVPNSCRSVYFAVYNQAVHTETGKDEHKYASYGACLMWCFLGIRSDRPFSQGGDSGSLVFDRFGRAVGLLICGTNERRSQTGSFIEVPDITSVVSLEVVLEDIGRQLELSEIRFANGTEVYC